MARSVPRRSGFVRLGSGGQRENCATVASPPAIRCAVERALLVGDQASEGSGAVAAAREPIE
jgi:hypothetical protein